MLRHANTFAQWLNAPTPKIRAPANNRLLPAAVAATLLSGRTPVPPASEAIRLSPSPPAPSPSPPGAAVDSQNPETLPRIVDDFVAQLAERLELPRDTTEAHLGELLVSYRDVARARTGRARPAKSDREIEPEAASIAPS